MLRLTRFETAHDAAGGGVRWLLYEDGQQARPLRALSPFEVAALLDQVEAQREPKREALQVDGTVRELRALADLFSRDATGVATVCATAADLLEAAATGTPLYTTGGKQ